MTDTSTIVQDVSVCCSVTVSLHWNMLEHDDASSKMTRRADVGAEERECPAQNPDLDSFAVNWNVTAPSRDISAGPH